MCMLCPFWFRTGVPVRCVSVRVFVCVRVGNSSYRSRIGVKELKLEKQGREGVDSEVVCPKRCISGNSFRNAGTGSSRLIPKSHTNQKFFPIKRIKVADQQ